MTEQEAIKQHISICNHRIETIENFEQSNQGANMLRCEKNIRVLELVIKALEEIQQYRAIGTVKKVKEYKEIADNINAIDLAELYCAIEELKKYQSIGTVEECREATEKQRAKKPLGGADVDGNEYAICRECSAILSDGEWFAKYCPDCGQKVDWNPDEP